MNPAATLLVVDSNAKAREAAARLLEQAGYAVAQAANGAQALRQCREQPPGLVLLDAALPDIPSLEVLRQIRADGLLAGVCVVLRSADEISPTQQASALDAGADDFIDGRTSTTELLARVRLHLRQRELTARLRASEALFRTLIQRSWDAFHLVEPGGRITYESPAVTRILGWAPEEMTGRNVVEFVHPDDLQAMQDGIPEDLVEPDKQRSLVLRVRHKDGSWRWVESCQVNLMDHPDVGAMAVNYRDITERKRAEEAQRESQSLLRMAGRAARLGGWSIDVATGETTWSDEICVIHDLPAGYRPTMEEAIAFYPPEYRAQVAGFIDACTHSGTSFDFELELITFQGRRIWVRAIGIPVRDAVGRIVGVQGAFQDISDRRHAQEDLQRMSKRLTTTLESIKDGFFTLDLAWRFTYVNAEAERMVLRLRADLIGVTLWDAFPETVGSAFERAYRRAIAENITVGFEEYYPPLGKWFEVRAYPSEEGLAVYFLDVTASRQVGLALRASEERFRFLNEAGEAVRKLAEPDQIMATVARMLGEYLRASRCAYADVEQDGDRFTIWHDYTNGCASTVGTYDLSAFGSRAVAVLTLGQTLIIRHVDEELRPEDGADTFNAIGIQAIVTCPLVKDGRLRAMMAVHQTTPRDWKPDEVAVVQEIVERCWAAIERQTAERNLQRSEERFRLLSRATSDAVWEWDMVSGAHSWNEGVTPLFGYARDEIEPTIDFCRERVHADDAAKMNETVRRAVQSGAESWSVDYRFRRKDGGYTPVLDSGYIIRNAEGQPVRMLGGMKDLTERRQVEEALRLRDRAIQALSKGILITDARQPDNPVIYASTGFERMTGYRSDDVMGRNCRFLQGKDTDPATVGEIRDAVVTGRACVVEILNYRKDGQPFWNALSINPVHDEKGAISHFIGVQNDITERRTLENQLRQSQKMEAVGRLAGGVAHDFNNLLTVITGYSEFLLDLPELQGGVRDSVKAISEAGDRAAALTRQLLGFSRQTMLQPKVLDLNAVVNDMGKMLRRLIGEDIVFTTVLDARLSRVKVDPGQLDQVLMNLAVNARDAMPKGGRLTVETANVLLSEGYAATHLDCKPGPYAMLAMTDTGCGMTPELMARIFEPFFTTKQVGKGTGLGLAMVFGIVQQSGGCIHVYSEPGHGTTFKIYLPAAAEPEGVPEGTDSRLGMRGTETILLVEDEEGVRALALLSLQTQGYRVLTAVDGKDALRVVQAHSGTIDLILTDVVMPTLSGPAMVELLKAQFPRIKVLFMSGYTDDAVVRHGLLEADVAFIQKPYTPTTLARKVRQVLDDATCG